MVFNILVGNTDDHAHDHAALWAGKALSPTPPMTSFRKLATVAR